MQYFFPVGMYFHAVACTLEYDRCSVLDAGIIVYEDNMFQAVYNFFSVWLQNRSAH
jgi:hypothetical protein